MTQWGGILEPLPPRDSLTGDTNSHTHTHFHRGYATVHAAYRYKTFQQFICSSILFSTFALYPFISSNKQTNKHIRSCQCSSCWFCFFYCWCLNWNFSHFVLIHYFFPSFHFSLSHIFVSIKNSQLFHVLQSCEWFIKLLTDSVLPLVYHIPVSPKSFMLSLIFHMFFQ